MYGEAIAPLVATPVEISNEGPLTARAMMSPFGVVDDHLQTRYSGARYTLEIEDWWLGIHICNKALQAHTWTRDGQLHLAVHYNEAFYEKEFVERYMDQWQAILLKEFVL